MANNCLIKQRVSELPEKWLNNISTEFLEGEVYLVKDDSKKEAGKLVTELMNFRFVCSQLGIKLQKMAKRQVWYIILKKQRGAVKLSGSNLQRYISLSEMMKTFCEKLTDFYKVPYWGLVLDKLRMRAKARATILDIEGIETGLNIKTFPNFKETPFFFLVCEKGDTLKSMMSELKKRGYNAGFYGLITQGYGSSNVVRLLMEVKKIKKFYVFVALDYDLDGLKIYFDLKRYFPCESVGLHPDMINETKIPASTINQDYDSPSGNAKGFQIKGAINMLNDLFGSNKKDTFDEELTDSEYLKLKSWIEGCIEKKIELDALLAHRLEEDQSISKSKDLVDYLELLLNDGSRVYDLNRYKKPTNWLPESSYPYVEKPEIIENIISELQELVIKPIEEFLEDNDLKYDSDWETLIQEEFDIAYDILETKFNKKLNRANEKLEAFTTENKEYRDSLTNVVDLIEDQDQKLYNYSEKQTEKLQKLTERQTLILRNKIEETAEYKRTEETLNQLKKAIINNLKTTENKDTLIKDCISSLQILYMSLEQSQNKEILEKAINTLERLI